VLSAPEIKNQIQNNGMLPVGSVSMPLRDFLNAEIARWGAVVRQAGIAGSL